MGDILRYMLIFYNIQTIKSSNPKRCSIIAETPMRKKFWLSDVRRFRMELQDIGKLLEMLQRVSPEKQEKILIFAQGVAAGVSAANAARDADEKKKPA